MSGKGRAHAPHRPEGPVGAERVSKAQTRCQRAAGGPQPQNTAARNGHRVRGGRQVCRGLHTSLRGLASRRHEGRKSVAILVTGDPGYEKLPDSPQAPGRAAPKAEAVPEFVLRIRDLNPKAEFTFLRTDVKDGPKGSAKPSEKSFHGCLVRRAHRHVSLEALRAGVAGPSSESFNAVESVELTTEAGQVFVRRGVCGHMKERRAKVNRGVAA